MKLVRWIIGDIHGMLRPLQALLGAIARRDPAAHLIFLGDYVNRGPDSKRVIDLLLSLSGATFLRGNHDDIFELLLHADCYICHSSAPDSVSAFTWFMRHGLAETLIQGLRPVFETEDFFAAHGYWDVDEPDDSPGLAWRLERYPPLRYRLLWGRFSDAQIRRKKRWKRAGYFGHTPVFNYPGGSDFTPIRGRRSCCWTPPRPCRSRGC